MVESDYRKVSVNPQFVVCEECGCVADDMLVKVTNGKVTTHCINCKSTKIHGGY